MLHSIARGQVPRSHQGLSPATHVTMDIAPKMTPLSSGILLELKTLLGIAGPSCSLGDNLAFRVRAICWVVGSSLS